MTLLDCFLFPAVPVVITELQLFSGPNCLPSETSVDIQCVNFGLPRPEIIFFRGAEQITPRVAPFTNFEQVSFDTMRLSGAQPWDGGDYVCVAKTGNLHLDRSQPKRLVYCSKYFVVVFSSPAVKTMTTCMSLFPTARPTIVDLPAPTTHTDGDHFELVCSFTGIPAPEIHWEKDGSLLLLGEGMRIVNSTGRSQLEIISLLQSDAGVYRCSVTNVAGMDTQSVRLEVRGEGVSWM